MDTRTGELVDAALLERMPELEQAHYVPVKRDLTKLEEMSRQIKMYSPCGCGSGKKFKFCCYKP